MPVLTRPMLPLHVELPPRQATLAGETEVLVVGGGPAGFGAAMGAAQAGARVVLAEKYGFFGGHATAALLTILMSYYNEIEPPPKPAEITLLPPDHGGGEPIAAGVLARFVERLVEAGGALAPSAATGYTVPFDPEVFKLVMLDMLDEAGVEYLLHSFASGVVGSPRVEGVVFEGKSGPLVITARAVVDCTGDGTRRILGGYTLTAEYVLEARKFDDVVARCCYPMDIHNPAGTGTVLKRLPPGEAFDIPLRALLPRDVENLIVAGRCISGSHEALSSYRVMPTSMATGHAAGVCAALAARSRTSPARVETREVQRELLRQGANLRGIVV